MLSRTLKALIFDFNGTLCLDEPLLLRLYQRVLAEEGVALPATDYEAGYLGLSDAAIFAKALTAAGRRAGAAKVAAMVARKSRFYLEAVAARPPLAPGATDLVRAASRRYRLAVASGAPRREIEWVLRHAGLRDCFAALVAMEDTERGKPHPAPFLKALAGLNGGARRVDQIQAGECLVLEDSLEGIRGAKAAGMRVIGVASTYPVERLAAEADRAVPALADLAPEELGRWFGSLSGTPG
ncbi:MAG: HAD family phosphatase [candidate division NC10 bacterium]